MAQGTGFTGSQEDLDRIRYMQSPTGDDIKFIKSANRFVLRGGIINDPYKSKLKTLTAQINGQSGDEKTYDNVNVDQLDLDSLKCIDTVPKVFCMYWYPPFFAVPKDAKACVETQIKNGSGYLGIAQSAKVRIKKLEEEQEGEKENKKSETENQNEEEINEESAKPEGTPGAIEATVKPKDKTGAQENVEEAVRDNPEVTRTETKPAEPVTEQQTGQSAAREAAAETGKETVEGEQKE